MGSATLASGKVAMGTNALIRQGAFNAGGVQEVIGNVVLAGGFGVFQGPVLKLSGGNQNGYVAYATNNQTSPLWHVRRLSAGAFVTDLSLTGQTLANGSHTYRFRYDDGILTLWIDGYLMISTADTTYGANVAAGWYANSSGTVLDSISLVGDEATTFSVTPSPIGNYGSPTAVTFTGFGTAWTPGTPGSPVFTVDHGALANQTVASASSATASYNAGSFLGIATFSDPSTGATCQVLVSSDPHVVEPGAGGDTWSPYKALVDFTGQHNEPGTLLTDQTTTIPAAYPYPAADLNFITAINHIYAAVVLQQAVPPLNLPSMADVVRILTGGGTFPAVEYPAVTNTTIKADVGYCITKLDELAVAAIDVDALIATLGGSPTIYSNADIMAALGNITAGSNQDVLDALTALQTYLAAEHTAIAGLIAELATPAGYTLGSVLDAIAAIQTGAVDLTPVLTAVSNLRGGTATVQGVRDLLAAVDDKIDALGADVTAIRTAGSLTLQSVLDAIAAIEIPPAAAYDGPPVWPGQSNVTLGASSALADDLVLVGPMHGLLITITGHPAFAQKYKFGPVDSWSRVGAVVFRSEQGSYERSQSFSLDTQVMVPATMNEAASSAFRVNPGWQGTVRTWYRNA